MKGIHNNPKIKEPRRPVILTEDSVNLWIDPAVVEFTKDDILPFLAPYPNAKLKAYTVPKLTGDFGVSNTPAATMEYIYPEIRDAGSQGKLF